MDVEVKEFIKDLNRFEKRAVKKAADLTLFTYQKFKKELFVLRETASKPTDEEMKTIEYFERLVRGNRLSEVSVWCSGYDEEKIRSLLDPTGRNLLHIACSHGSAPVVRILLKKFPSAFTFRFTNLKDTYLTLACHARSVHCARIILSTPSLNPRVLLTQADGKFRLPMMIAGLNNDLEMIGVLISSWEVERSKERAASSSASISTENFDAYSDPFYDETLIRISYVSREMEAIIKHYTMLSYGKNKEATGGIDSVFESTRQKNNGKMILIDEEFESEMEDEEVPDVVMEEIDDEMTGIGDAAHLQGTLVPKEAIPAYKRKYDLTVIGADFETFVADALSQLRTQSPMVYQFQEIYDRMNPSGIEIEKKGKERTEPKPVVPATTAAAKMVLALTKGNEDREAINRFLVRWRNYLSNSDEGAAPINLLATHLDPKLGLSFASGFFTNEQGVLIPRDTDAGFLLHKGMYLQKAILALAIQGKEKLAEDALFSFFSARRFPLSRSFVLDLFNYGYSQISQEVISRVLVELAVACPQSDPKYNLLYRTLMDDVFSFSFNNESGEKVELSGSLVFKAICDGHTGKLSLILKAAKLVAEHTGVVFDLANLAKSVTVESHHDFLPIVLVEAAQPTLDELAALDEMKDQFGAGGVNIPPPPQKSPAYDDNKWHLNTIYQEMLFRWHSRLYVGPDYSEVSAGLLLPIKMAMATKKHTFTDLLVSVFENKSYSFFDTLLTDSNIKYLLKYTKCPLPEFADLNFVQSLAIASMDPYWMAVVFLNFPVTEGNSAATVDAEFELWKEYIEDCYNQAVEVDGEFSRDYSVLFKLAQAFTSGQANTDFTVSLLEVLTPLCAMKGKQHNLLKEVMESGLF